MTVHSETGERAGLRCMLLVRKLYAAGGEGGGGGSEEEEMPDHDEL